MELPLRLSCLLLHVWLIIRAGWCQAQCAVDVVSSEEFVPFGEWVQLNCTYNCSTPSWESRLQKRNLQKGDTWVATEVLVEDWEKSSISCIQALNDREIQESIVTVAAYALPSKVTIDLEEELQEGQRQTVTCTVFNVAPVSNLQIFAMRGGRIIGTSTFEDDTTQGLQTLAESYDFEASRRDNFQDFYCQAILELGGLQDNMVLSESISVKTYAPPDLPNILVKPSTTVHEHESFNLTCQSEGFPEPEFFWTVPANADVIYSQDKSQVFITKATQEHMGVYECEARNNYGRVHEFKDIKIMEQPTASPDIPQIHVTPNTSVTEGGSLNLTCQSNGNPKPEYFWTVPAKAPVTYSKDKSKVVITKATSVHNGLYTCQARNRYGEAKQEQVIHIKGQGNGVSNTRAADVLLLTSVLASIWIL